jgi:hypothetical protein
MTVSRRRVCRLGRVPGQPHSTSRHPDRAALVSQEVESAWRRRTWFIRKGVE